MQDKKSRLLTNVSNFIKTKCLIGYQTLNKNSSNSKSQKRTLIQLTEYIFSIIKGYKYFQKMLPFFSVYDMFFRKALFLSLSLRKVFVFLHCCCTFSHRNKATKRPMCVWGDWALIGVWTVKFPIYSQSLNSLGHSL